MEDQEEWEATQTVYQDEYISALTNRFHPKHKAAMRIRAERLKNKDKSVPFVENGEMTLISYR